MATTQQLGICKDSIWLPIFISIARRRGLSHIVTCTVRSLLLQLFTMSLTMQTSDIPSYRSLSTFPFGTSFQWTHRNILHGIRDVGFVRTLVRWPRESTRYTRIWRPSAAWAVSWCGEGAFGMMIITHTHLQKVHVCRFLVMCVSEQLAGEEDDG